MQNGFINLLKPPGMTSHDAVSFVRRIYGQKKVGHAGTLDPAAAGVLPIALGQATRLLEYITDVDKSYRAEVTLGYSTDSGDDTGTVILSSPFVMPALAELEAALQSFCGEIKQIPPMHSAIKVNGQKLYTLARQGISVEVPERIVHIYKIALLDVQEKNFLIDVDCSKGTYIRTLCIDIGKQLDIPAVMSFLVRTRVGSFSLGNACTLEEIKDNPMQALMAMDDVLDHIPSVYFSAEAADAFRQGQKIRYDMAEAIPCLRIYDEKNELVGIGTYNAERRCIVPVKVIVR